MTAPGQKKKADISSAGKGAGFPEGLWRGKRSFLLPFAGSVLFPVFIFFFSSCTRSFPEESLPLYLALVNTSVDRSESHTVSGTVVDLTGTGLVLQNNQEELAVDSSGRFQFPTAVSRGVSYNVTVQTQPTGPTQSCVVQDGSGTVQDRNITDVVVNCSGKYVLGGTSSSVQGTGLTLVDQIGGQTTEVTTDGSFVFSSGYDEGDSYQVEIQSQPSSPDQVCNLSNGTGTFASSDQTNLGVVCSSSKYPLRIHATGIVPGWGTLLASVDVDGAVQTMNVTANGLYTFANSGSDGLSYTYSVAASPSGHSCSVIAGATGTISGVTTATINCDYTPLASMFPPDESAISTKTKIFVFFTQSMNPASCSITGPLGAVTTSWMSRSTTDDTLVIEPSSGDWNVGYHSLDVTGCQSTGGLTAPSIYRDFNVYANVRYVSVGGAGTGLSPTVPMGNIQNAINDLDTGGFGCATTEDCVVLVSGGVYNEVLTLKDGISIYGSYTADFGDRNYTSSQTQIINTVDANPVLITAPSAITGNVRLDRLFMRQAITSNMQVAGLRSLGGSPFLNVSDLRVRNFGTGNTYAYYADVGSGGLIQGSMVLVTESSGAAFSYGIYSNQANLSVTKSVVTGGNANNTYGVYDTNAGNAKTGYTSNVIIGGSGSSGTVGMHIQDPSLAVSYFLYNNIILGGPASTSTVGVLFMTDVSNVEVRNNIVGTLDSGLAPFSHCVQEGGVGLAPLYFENNNLFQTYGGGLLSCQDSLYMDDAITNLTDICGAGTPGDATCTTLLSGTTSSANSSLDPMFNDPATNDYSFKTDGTARCPVTLGGQTHTVDTVSIEWYTRTTPYSMGAYEYDGGCTP